MSWTQEQLNNARIIISTGHQMGMSERDIQVALMTAMTESRLVNVHYGDGSSLGLFQQIDSWGSAQQREDPVWSATAFYNALRGVTDRGSMTLGQAAQAVQRSAYPDRYAEWTSQAAALLGLKGGPAGGGEMPGGIGQINQGSEPIGAAPTPAPTIGSTAPASTQAAAPVMGPPIAAQQTNALNAPGMSENRPFDTAATLTSLKMPTIPGLGQPGAPIGGGSTGLAAGWRGQVVAGARQLLGIPYVWGGNDLSGLDCSGMVQYVYKQLGVNLPRISYQQANYGQHIGLDALKPGDLVAWDLNSRNNGADHIAIYIGNGMIIEAPRPGMSVQISHLYDQGQAWGVRMTR